MNGLSLYLFLWYNRQSSPECRHIVTLVPRNPFYAHASHPQETGLSTFISSYNSFIEFDTATARRLKPCRAKVG